MANQKRSSSKKTNSVAPKPSNIRSAHLTIGKGRNSKDVSVREIDNGFIIRESWTTGKGDNYKYNEREKFSPTNPLRVDISSGSPKGRFGKKK